MSVRVKYQVIENLSINIKTLALSKSNILALASGQEQDWLLLFQMNSQYQLQRIQEPNMERRPISLLQWSPVSDKLASSYDRLIIWEYRNGSLNQMKEFQGHSLEITAMNWSPDGLKVVTTSLDGKILIYDIESGSVQHKIEEQTKTLGVAWDPFNKYIACLTFENHVKFYRITTWNLETDISLNSTNKSPTTSKREDRKIDWSPDCRYLLVPNLDDKLVPSVNCLDRNNDFQVTRTFIGPFSSINAISFSPLLFQNENENGTVFAMGDNDGNLSVWKLSSDYYQNPNQKTNWVVKEQTYIVKRHQQQSQQNQPIALFLGYQNNGELIEDICWHKNGTFLIATTARKYLLFVDFQDNLGKKLSQDSVEEILKDMYGNAKNTSQTVKAYVNKQIITKKYDDMQLESLVNMSRQPQIIVKSEVKQQNTQFKTIIENGKKKCIPITTEVQPNNVNNTNQDTQPKHKPHIPQPLLQLNQYQIVPKNYVYQFPFQQKSLHLEVQKQSVKVFNQPTFGTVIRCFQQNEISWIDYVEGQVKAITTSEDKIVIYTDQSLLYVESMIGQRMIAPLALPFLSQIEINSKNQLLCLETNGDFKILDLEKKTVILEGDIKNLMKIVYDWMDKKFLLNELEKEGKQAVQTLIKATLKVDQDGFPIPEFLMKDYGVYRYNKEFKQWMKLKTIEINQQQQQQQQQQQDVQKMVAFQSFQIPLTNDSSLYDRLICKTTMVEAVNDIQQIAKFEEQLVQYQINEDVHLYVQTICVYIRKLCETLPMNFMKLREAVKRYLQNTDSKEYQYISAKTDITQFRDKIIYIMQQYPKADPIIDFLQL